MNNPALEFLKLFEPARASDITVWESFSKEHPEIGNPEPFLNLLSDKNSPTAESIRVWERHKARNNREVINAASNKERKSLKQIKDSQNLSGKEEFIENFKEIFVEEFRPLITFLETFVKDETQKSFVNDIMITCTDGVQSRWENA